MLTFSTLVEFLKSTSKQKTDISLLMFFPVLAGFLSLLFKLTFIPTVFLFFYLPSFYLALRYKQNIVKSLLFSLIVSIPFVTVLDYIAHFTGTWHVPSSFEQFRILGLVPLEDYVWGFGQAFFIIMYYESLIDLHIKPHVGKNIKNLLILLIIVSSLFGYIYSHQHHLLNIPYFYILAGIIVFLLPTVILLIRRPKLWIRFSKVMIYFFYVSIVYELTALTLGHWYFPNNDIFLKMIHIGNLAFPIEELIIWMILTSIGLLSYFEVFVEE